MGALSMYPQQFFKLFPSAPTESKVFVMMAFDDRHRPRWEKVIQPAIRAIGLEPLRVDAGRVSDSILTQILQGIGSSRLVFADVSTLDGYRNPNVLYEHSIAHAVREATEVVIFRDDGDRLPFDVANVRVNRYEVNPDHDPEAARTSVQFALADALREFDLTKSMAVRIAMRKLDQTSYNVLVDALVTGAISHPQRQTMRQAVVSLDALRSLTSLLEGGLLQSEYPDFYVMAQRIGTPESIEMQQFPIQYKLTELGRVVIMEIVLQHGGTRMVEDAELRARLDTYFSETPT